MDTKKLYQFYEDLRERYSIIDIIERLGLSDNPYFYDLIFDVYKDQIINDAELVEELGYDSGHESL